MKFTIILHRPDITINEIIDVKYSYSLLRHFVTEVRAVESDPRLLVKKLTTAAKKMFHFSSNTTQEKIFITSMALKRKA